MLIRYFTTEAIIQLLFILQSRYYNYLFLYTGLLFTALIIYLKRELFW